MVVRDEVMKLVNTSLSEVLDVAQAALPESQFRAFRKLVLNQFGQARFGKGLDRVLGDVGRVDRNSGRPIHAKKEVCHE